MIDYSQIKTIDELEYHTKRLQRRAEIQRRQVESHFEFVAREYHYIKQTIDNVINPVRQAINEYWSAFKVFRRIAKAFIPRKR